MIMKKFNFFHRSGRLLLHGIEEKTAYIQLLGYIKATLAPGWSPTEVMCDFVKSLRRAVTTVYEQAQV
jgi:hypothetical protein